MVSIDIESPLHLNMNSANARSFLEFLGLPPGDEPYGEATLPDCRRGIMRARSTFENRVGKFTRDGSDTKRPGQARFIEGGNTPEYFKMRLDHFERFLNAVIARGAVSIYWA